MKSEDFLLVLLVAIFLVSMMLSFQGFRTTGYATTASTSSNVSITKYFSIALSQNLSNGVTFGAVNLLPINDINATQNNNSMGGNTSLFVNVSSDSNTAVDFCLSANSGLVDPVGGGTIPIANESYQNSSTTSYTFPGSANNATSLTTSYVKASAPTGVGNASYFRFWLDVPSATASGNYNNTINFEGVQTTLVC